MAVPTITGVSPTTVYAGGQMVTLTGTNFRTAYAVPNTFQGPLPVPPPTMSVAIAGKPATRVVVLSNTELTCFVPPGKPGKTNSPNPAVAIVVHNLDSAGDPIGGETATLLAALTYARVDLTVEDDFTRLVRSLINLLKEQVIENVTKQCSVDYSDRADASEFVITQVQTLPALVVTGPAVKEDNFYDLDRRAEVQVVGGYQTRLTWLTVDLVFKIYGYDDSEARGLGLFALLNKVISFNSFLTMDRDPDDLSKGTVEYEMDWQASQFSDQANTSDVRSFSVDLIVRGFQFEDVAGFRNRVFEQGGTFEDLVLETDRKT